MAAVKYAPPFIPVTEELLRDVGPRDACLLSLIEFRTRPSHNGAVELDGARWWSVSMQSLSETMGMGKATMERAVESLESSGRILVVRDRGAANLYRLAGYPHNEVTNLDNPPHFDDTTPLKMSTVEVPSPYIGKKKNNTLTSKQVRPDVQEVCEHLSRRIKENSVKKGTGTITTQWREDARKLIDLDGVKPGVIHAVIDWCQNDSFWKGNILSMRKLREKFDQLALKAESQGVNLQHGSKFKQLLDDGDVTALDSLAADKASPPWRDNLNWMGHESDLEVRRLKTVWWTNWWELEGEGLL